MSNKQRCFFSAQSQRPHQTAPQLDLTPEPPGTRRRALARYSREWIDPRLDRIGQMEATRLSTDLTHPVGDPVTLFDSTDAPWSNQDLAAFLVGGVVDGPWLHRTCDAQLLMLWSSYSGIAYTTGVARSSSGSVLGPWQQLPTPFFAENGGHASLFVDLGGVVRATFHAPSQISEHPTIIPVGEGQSTLTSSTVDDAARRPC